MSFEAITSSLNNYLSTIDLNGAVRQCGLSTAMVLLSLAATIIHGKRWITHNYLEDEAAKMLLAIIVFFMSSGLLVFAYIVRNPCRTPRGYYIGCGVNDSQTAGLTLAIILAVIGMVPAVFYAMPTGWLVAAYGCYYVDYMAQFSHQLSPLTRATAFLIPALALTSVGVAQYAQIAWRLLKAHKFTVQLS